MEDVTGEEKEDEKGNAAACQIQASKVQKAGQVTASRAWATTPGQSIYAMQTAWSKLRRFN